MSHVWTEAGRMHQDKVAFLSQSYYLNEKKNLRHFFQWLSSIIYEENVIKFQEVIKKGL